LYQSHKLLYYHIDACVDHTDTCINHKYAPIHIDHIDASVEHQRLYKRYIIEYAYSLTAYVVDY
jgi:hypothetical protein